MPGGYLETDTRRAYMGMGDEVFGRVKLGEILEEI